MRTRCHLILNKKGMTMIELLAVIVILGILSAIAIPLMGHLIQEAKDRAFVANAFRMKEAASLHIRAQLKVLEEGQSKPLYYHELVDEGFLEPFQDPDTGEYMPLDESYDKSYVELSNNYGMITYRIFLKGIKRQISLEDNISPIPVQDVTKESIRENPN